MKNETLLGTSNTMQAVTIKCKSTLPGLNMVKINYSFKMIMQLINYCNITLNKEILSLLHTLVALWLIKMPVNISIYS